MRSSAARLAARGHDVDLSDTQPFPGGKAGSEQHDGYRFDTGPSLVTMPEVFDQLFAEAGEQRDQFIALSPLDEICRYSYEDGAVVFFLGTKQSFPELGLHNIFFSGDYRAEFRDIWENRSCPSNPTVHVNITSKHTPAGSKFGSLYGISSNSRMAAFMRHPNRSKRYQGLFFCGGSAHPGGGMPLVVLSGKIAADLIRRDIERGRL